jgi:hypothetical protein
MTKPPGSQFETVVKRLLSTPPKPHRDTKAAKAKPGSSKPAKKPVKRGSKQPDDSD